MPKLGLSREEIAERKREALKWDLETGAMRDVVQTYRRARLEATANSRYSTKPTSLRR